MQDNGLGKATKQFYTTGEVGLLLGCSSYWVTQLIEKGELDTHRIGDSGWHRIGVKSLERYAVRHDIDLEWWLLEAAQPQQSAKKRG